MVDTTRILNAKLRQAAAQFAQLPRALKLVWDAAPGWTAAWGDLLLLQGLLPVATVYVVRNLVNESVVASEFLRRRPLTSRWQSFQNELPTHEKSLADMAAINRELIGEAESVDPPGQRTRRRLERLMTENAPLSSEWLGLSRTQFTCFLLTNEYATDISKIGTEDG